MMAVVCSLSWFPTDAQATNRYVPGSRLELNSSCQSLHSVKPYIFWVLLKVFIVEGA